MTNLEALNSVIGGNYPFDQNVFEKTLLDNGLTDSDTYNSGNEKQIDYAVMSLILTVVLSPNIEQGGYKVTQSDKVTLLTVRNTLRTKYGLPIDNQGIPRINKVKVW